MATQSRVNKTIEFLDHVRSISANSVSNYLSTPVTSDTMAELSDFSDNHDFDEPADQQFRATSVSVAVHSPQSVKYLMYRHYDNMKTIIFIP